MTSTTGIGTEISEDWIRSLPKAEVHVHLEGTLEITTENRVQTATTLDLQQGPYELTLSPSEAGGWTISGRVQSKVVGDLRLGGTP